MLFLFTIKEMTVKYPNLLSAVKPVSHCEEVTAAGYPDATLSDRFNSETSLIENISIKIDIILQTQGAY